MGSPCSSSASGVACGLPGAATDIEHTLRPPNCCGGPQMRVVKSKLGIIEVCEIQCCFFRDHLSLQPKLVMAARGGRSA
jgi:hypothetical protein